MTENTIPQNDNNESPTLPDDILQDLARRMKVVHEVKARMDTDDSKSDDWQPSDALYLYEIAWISTHGSEPMPVELEKMFEELCQESDRADKAEAENKHLQRELAAAREALKPFADATKKWSVLADSMVEITCEDALGFHAESLMLLDFRNAARALSAADEREDSK